MKLNDRVAIITGAGSGIGAACARAFAQRGTKVVVVHRNAAGAQQVAQDIGGLAIACDIGSEEQVNALVERTQRELGPVDVFFSNAGIATGSDPLSTPLDVWAEQWQVNLMSHVYAVRAVLPGMLQRGQGYLLHTASMAGILTSAGNLPYAVTKHAVVGLAEWLSVTYHDQGIRVGLLAPLGVRTPMLGPTDSAFARNFAGPIKEPEEVAQMVLEAVTRLLRRSGLHLLRFEERYLLVADRTLKSLPTPSKREVAAWRRRKSSASLPAAPVDKTALSPAAARPFPTGKKP